MSDGLETEASAEDAVATVVLADDHAVMRGGLRMLLDAQPGLMVVGEAGDLEAARRMVRARRPDVLVLDLNMPGTDSLPAIPELRADAPDTRIVVLTMQSEPGFAQAALQSGAAGYVIKEAASEELVQAIRAALDGRTYLHPEIGAKIAAQQAQGAGGRDQLTEREREVLGLVAHGYTNPEIASQLFLSTRTVESHRASIQRKLDLSTRAELVRYALDHGMLEQ